MSFILIDSKTRQPVPLPFHTSDSEGPMRVINWISETELDCRDDGTNEMFFIDPGCIGLELISEEAFMAEQDDNHADDCDCFDCKFERND